MLRYVARSDAGLVREGNEDSGYAGPHLLAVADGMGGHAAGEVASKAAIDELVQVGAGHPDSFSAEGPSGQSAGSDAGHSLGALAAAFQAANERIRAIAADDPARDGMGTTVTAMLWTGSAFALGHVGDSRAYLFRDGELSQLTHDHTFVQALVDDGRITVEDAREHPARSVVTKALQGQAECDADYSLFEVRAGDRVLICSDGLSDVVSDDAIVNAAAPPRPVDEAADALIELTTAGGAPDNVTIVLADVLEADDGPAADGVIEATFVGAAG